jgi:hypothetical protein
VHVGDALALLDLDSLRAPRSRRARERGQRGDVRRLAASWPGVPELESLLLGRLAALEAARFLDARGAREA